MIDPFGYYQAPIQFLCPSCHGERRVFRMTPSYEAMVAQAAGGSFGWTGPTHEWRTCPLCKGSGLLSLSGQVQVVPLPAVVAPRLPYPMDAHVYNHDPGVNGCRACGGSKDWPVHRSYARELADTSSELDTEDLDMITDLLYKAGVRGTTLKKVQAMRVVAPAPSDPDPFDLDYMCPNCCTPFKCNGPHIPEGEV